MLESLYSPKMVGLANAAEAHDLQPANVVHHVHHVMWGPDEARRRDGRPGADVHLLHHSRRKQYHHYSWRQLLTGLLHCLHARPQDWSRSSWNCQDFPICLDLIPLPLVKFSALIAQRFSSDTMPQ